MGHVDNGPSPFPQAYEYTKRICLTRTRTLHNDQPTYPQGCQTSPHTPPPSYG
ncbi:hypothetical protein BDN67DRAFT_974945 [Paxillus ammoniavirescens]|nr:hypothetical protein BDN67DRAFT_974945 [Paxillus ammoniavirescens]